MNRASLILQTRMAQHLQRSMKESGSTLFSMTWNLHITPGLRPIYRLRASERPTEGSGCSSWPTPVANDDNKSVEAHLAMKRRMGERDGTGSERTAITSLQVMATLASWPTPAAQNWKHESGEWACSRERMTLHAPPLNRMATMASWPTPNTPTGGPNFKSTETHTGGMDLDGAATLAGWPTPRANDNIQTDLDAIAESSSWLGQGRGATVATMAQLTINPDGPARLTAGGQLLTGSSAGIGSGGQLRPEHSRWLMGLPAVWSLLAPPARRKLDSK